MFTYVIQTPESNIYNEINENVLRNRNSNLNENDSFNNLNNNNNVYSKTPQTTKLNNRPRYLGNEINNNQTVPTIYKVETCDKSTFTVNEISTQTDQLLNDQFFSMENNIVSMEQEQRYINNNSKSYSK